MAVVMEFEDQRQQCLDPDDAGRRLGEGQALAFLILRRVVGGDGVDGAVLEPLDDGLAVHLGAQRRR